MEAPDCRDAVIELASGLGLGEVVSMTRDEIVTTWNQTYIYDSTALSSTQRKHGTGNVHHIPHPLLAIKVNKGSSSLSFGLDQDPRLKSFLIITDERGLDDNTVRHLRYHLSRRYPKLRILSQASLTPDVARKLFPQVAGILFHTALQDELYYYIALAAHTPFTLRYRPADKNLTTLLSSWDLGICLSPSSDYYTVKNSLRLLLKHRNLLSTRIENGVRAARNKLKWASSIRGMRNARRPPPGVGTLNLYVNPYDYSGNLQTMAKSLATHNLTGGYHFELDAGTTFLDEGAVYFHMWIGMIWETDIDVLEQLVSHPAFGVSTPYCLGLLVTTQYAMEILRGLLDGYGFAVSIVNCEGQLQGDKLIPHLATSHLGLVLK